MVGFAPSAGGASGAVRPHLPAQGHAAPCRKAPAAPPAASATQANYRGGKNDAKISCTIKSTTPKTCILLCRKFCFWRLCDS